MFPSFRPGDLLHTTAYSKFDDIRLGDAVIYTAPDGKNAGHRIIRIKKEKISTRGDNNNLTDPYLLAFSDLIGRVDWIERKKKRMNAYGGIRGRAWHCLMQARKAIWVVSVFLFQPVYRRLSELFSFVPVNPKDAKSVTFQRPWGREFKIFINDHLIAKKNLATGETYIDVPYRFLYGSYLKKHGFELRRQEARGKKQEARNKKRAVRALYLTSYFLLLTSYFLLLDSCFC